MASGDRDAEHVWLATATAAVIVGFTAPWMRHLAETQRAPATRVGRRWWWRRDLIEAFGAARGVSSVKVLRTASRKRGPTSRSLSCSCLECGAQSSRSAAITTSPVPSQGLLAHRLGEDDAWGHESGDLAFNLRSRFKSCPRYKSERPSPPDCQGLSHVRDHSPRPWNIVQAGWP